MATDPEPKARIKLAREPDFALGGLWVSPSACRVRAAGRDERVEPRVMEVLLLLVRAGGATVSREELIEACWGGRIVSDDAITRAIAKVRGLARGIDPPPFVIETIPKIGFRLAASGAIESPPSVTPPSRPAWRSPAVLAAAVVLILAVGGWLLWRGLAPAAAHNGRVELAAFSPRPPEPALQQISVRLGDALVRLLASNHIETAPAPGAGGRDDAEFRIAGSVDRQDAAYVVNAQIQDRASGLVLWSGDFRRPSDAASGLEEEAAYTIAGFLRCALEDRPARRRIEPAVFGLYLRACEAAISGDADHMRDATDRLVRAAPDFAGAYALQGIARALVAMRAEHAPEESAKLRGEARAAAQKALDLDPDTPKAYVALGLSYETGADWGMRETYFRRALDLDPTLPPARTRYLSLLRETGRLNEALELSARTNETADARGTALAQEALQSAALRGPAAAEPALSRIALFSPPIARNLRWTIAFWWDDLAAARALLAQLGPESNDPRQMACLETYLAALPAPGGPAVRGLPTACERIPPDWRLRMLARQGDIDGAYAELAKAPPRMGALFYPEMKAFRRDPRFMPLMARTGLLDYWRKSGRWPDFCAEPDLPYDCRARP